MPSKANTQRRERAARMLAAYHSETAWPGEPMDTRYTVAADLLTDLRHLLSAEEFILARYWSDVHYDAEKEE